MENEKFIENIKSNLEKSEKKFERIYIDISTYNKLNEEQAIKLYNVVKEYNVVTKIIVLDDKNLKRYRLKENGKLILIWEKTQKKKMPNI